ncbi:MAG: M48 family metallopeptidase [Oscillospiraceae bacterium]|nr:M48 family metallopeptidase [Oscillospiraceae bacterium]
MVNDQLRTVQTPEGTVCYTLSCKRVKNWNLRVKDRLVLLSAPMRTGGAAADEFVRSRAQWIFRALARQQSMEKLPLEQLPRDRCMRILSRAVERTYPLVAPLGVTRPEVRLRSMRSQWGNCHYLQGYITLNMALASCPEPLQDYVVLHELAHFLHHDHGQGFYGVMDRLMPDWKQRRKALKQYRIE